MKNVYALLFTTSTRASISMRGSSNDVSLEYSYDGIDWSEWDLSVLKINLGDKLYIRGNNPRGLSHKNVKHYKFIIEGGKVSCSGNIMSLIDYKNLPNIIPCDYCFCELFSGCAALTFAPELPAKKLAKCCYGHMFYGCSSLAHAPELPATTLADSCYSGMFFGCTGLTTAPELPATKLTDWCYSYMFFGCDSLTTAPELPATTLAKSCYDGMFYGCSSLKAAPELPATKLAKDCYYQMFDGCTSLKNAPELPVKTLKEYCKRHLSSMLKD